jgi:hypothetical protein
LTVGSIEWVLTQVLIQHALKADDTFVSLLNRLHAPSIIPVGRTYSGPYVGDGGSTVGSIEWVLTQVSIRHTLKVDDTFVSLLNGLNAPSIIPVGRTYLGPYVGRRLGIRGLTWVNGWVY